MKVHQLTMVEQGTGGYLAMCDGKVLDFGFGEAVFPEETLLELLKNAAAGWEGPTEIYSQARPVHRATIEGQPISPSEAAPFSIGDRVVQMTTSGDQVYGEIIQSRSEDTNQPETDAEGNPILLVLSDPCDVYRDLDKWQLARSR
jgi:hypothetical protein